MRIARATAALLALALVATSAVAKNGAPSRLFPYYEEDTGVTLVGQVMVVANREEILNAGTHYRFLLSTGIADADITDGRLVVVALYCCNPKIAENLSIWAYVPAPLTVEREDLIEVRMGRAPNKDGDRGVVNAVWALRQKSADAAGGSCRWTPDDPGLWMRVVHCEGMEEQGWQQRGSQRKLWFLRAGAEPTKSEAAPAAETASAPVSATPVPAAEAAPLVAATATCISVSVEPDLAQAVLRASAAMNPPVQAKLRGSAEAVTCARTLDLEFQSSVNDSGQKRNRDGAMMMGPAGLIGALTPWPCPTTHSLYGSLKDANGASLGSFQASREQKRVGTMLVCGEPAHPSESIAIELVQTVLKQAEAAPVDASAALPAAPPP